jgi:hypothetical protein
VAGAKPKSENLKKEGVARSPSVKNKDGKRNTSPHVSKAIYHATKKTIVIKT